LIQSAFVPGGPELVSGTVVEPLPNGLFRVELTNGAKVLAHVADRVGLDYFIVDCAETKSGSLLIFEADNTAIVHNMDPPDVFPYKPPQMRKLFDAFADMLDIRARLGRERAA